MSALHLKMLTLCCLYFTVRTNAETTGVVWKMVGEDITIQCRGSDKEQYLTLVRGLNKTVKLLFTGKSVKNTLGDEIRGRNEINVNFPNVDILIKNLSVNDMGPYWCEYKNVLENGNHEVTTGEGSVLLVVTEHKEECKPSAQSDQTQVIVSVGIAGVVLLLIIVTLFIWFISKTKSSPTTRKKRQNVTSDVYEDMRGTLRR